MWHMTDITRHDDQLRSSLTKSQVSEFPYRREWEESQWPVFERSNVGGGLEVWRFPRHGWEKQWGTWPFDVETKISKMRYWDIRFCEVEGMAWPKFDDSRTQPKTILRKKLAQSIQVINDTNKYGNRMWFLRIVYIYRYVCTYPYCNCIVIYIYIYNYVYYIYIYVESSIFFSHVNPGWKKSRWY